MHQRKSTQELELKALITGVCSLVDEQVTRNKESWTVDMRTRGREAGAHYKSFFDIYDFVLKSAFHVPV